ncbi:MAG: ABC transporter ATP-binding protein, partial [Myxococcales bacterium]|nr:ABC transporter ATP-binding protein [Myxococcales bacterium]
MSDAPIINVSHLGKTFRTGLRGTKVEAVRDVSFTVQRGQALGYLGPNGSGKTTSIKCMLGLIEPTRGDIELFGRKTSDPMARARIGYMPEHPYFYDYLKPTEVLDYVGQLFGISAEVRKTRIVALLERLGLGHAMNRTLRGFSKGMLQRVGIAQSLINDPDLLVYDEPMSGLDPIGRKELRDLMVELREEGRTLFITSHVLSDIESVCDSVVILNEGAAIAEGTLDSLLHRDRLLSEAMLRLPGDVATDALTALADVEIVSAGEGLVSVRLPPTAVSGLTATVTELGGQLVELHPVRDTLEELFMREAVAVSRTDSSQGG